MYCTYTRLIIAFCRRRNITTTNKLMQMVKVIMAAADLRPRFNVSSCGVLSHAIIG